MNRFKKTLLLNLTLLGTALFLVTSCDPEETPPAVNSNAYVNDWILDNMLTYYYWTDRLPETSDKTLAPDAYFESLLYRFNAQAAPDGDRFSWIEKDWSVLKDDLSGVVALEIGFDYSLLLMSQGSDAVIGQITFVKKGTPAQQAGLKRGMWFNMVNGIALTTTNYRTALSVYSSTYTLSLLNETYSATNKFTGFAEGATLTLNTSSNYAEHPLYLDTVYTLNETTKVGYLVYNFFAPDKGDGSLAYEKAVNTAFARFKTAGINHLVVDLRYNSGGYSSSGTYLASLIVPVLDPLNVYTYYRYNNELTRYFISRDGVKSLNTYFTNAIVKDGRVVEMLNPIGDQLDGFYVLTGEYTASASEQLINGLKAYRNMVLIGATTYGKNVASISIYEEDDLKNRWGLQPIVAKFFNKNGQSDFTAGFEPDFPVDDTGVIGMLELGNAKEALLKTALDQIAGQPASAPVQRSLRQRSPSLRSPNAIQRGLVIDNGPVLR